MYCSIFYINFLPTLQIWGVSWKQILTSFLNEAGHIYYFNAITLFLCLSWMLLHILKVFGQRIEHHQRSSRRMTKSVSVLKNLVFDWKRHYLLIDQLVDQLNNCFCVILLVIFTTAFIRSVNLCFTFTSSYSQQNEWTGEASIGMIYYLLIEYFLIVQVAYVSQLIATRVVIPCLLSTVLLQLIVLRISKCCRQRI